MRTFASPHDAAPSHTIGDSVYFSLRKNIVNLNLKPGEALNVKAISEKLGVSRTPVRDAFIKLEKEGLVDVFPQKGTSVSRIDLKRVDEERFIRESLAEKAMELFMRERPSSAIARLSANLQLQRECEARNDCLGFLEHDDEFHGIVFQATDKEMSWRLIRSMSGHYRRVRLMSLWDGGVLSDVLAQHEAILRHIQAGDLPAVLEAQRSHLTKIVLDERALMRAYPGYFVEEAAGDFLMDDFLSAL